ncbi:MAG TPA: 16S rRNA (cytidine(1402)-2'-O)-methyltransferase [Acetobacteraceae bacterium]|nr:16S rRNA (cytidine(1402)-2'-O)-methyltransferase [Acetobacteraceae bacterium]
MPGGLVLVSTPIGNLGDMTARGIAALRGADLVLCEDTRVARRLLSAFGIVARLSALHEHNEERRIPALLAALEAGRRVALISDAGTPVLSDPGFRLVRAAVAAGLPVSAVPGPSAALMALTISGLPPSPFLFLGFPPPRAAARRAAFARVAGWERAGLRASLVWHEAPHRLAATLADLAAAFGTREAAVARELTKRFEEVRRGTLAALAAHYREAEARGEVTLVVGPAAPEAAEVSPAGIEARLKAALAGGMSVKEAVAAVAGETGAKRREVYAAALALKGGA